MPHKRNAVTVQINDHAGFVTFILRGVVYGPDLLDITERTYRQLDEPWRYNRLYDIRGFINILQYEDFVALTEQWPKLAGRPAQMRWAILTEDPVRIARAEAFAPLFPQVEVRVFGKLKGAISWLTGDFHAHHVAA